jgi:hypothetical protein
MKFNLFTLTQLILFALFLLPVNTMAQDATLEPLLPNNTAVAPDQLNPEAMADVVMPPPSGVAPSDSLAQPTANVNAQPDLSNDPKYMAGSVNPTQIPSLLFTFWEHAAIRDARNRIGLVRAPTEDELNKALKESAPVNKPKPPPEEREIKLGGIVYAAKDDWTIWLNGQRVTPEALPKEIIDLRVYGNYVEMKWLDDYTLQIYPLRMRAHQRFNLDSRIFLPG